MWGHILAHFAGLTFFVALMGILFIIQSWEYASEMRISGELILPPLIVTLIVIFAINFKDKDRLKVYLRIGLRLLILFLFFKF